MVEDDDDSFTLLLEIFNNWSTVLLSSSRRRRGKIDLQDFILHTAKQTLAGGTGYARTQGIYSETGGMMEERLSQGGEELYIPLN
jgi:hypothetical protein